MNDAGVPESVEDLISRYDRLILWEIYRVARQTRKLSLQPEDVEDYRQAVYLRVVEKGFLDRCQVYYRDNVGKFSTSLTRLVRNLMLNVADVEHRNPLQHPAGDAETTAFDERFAQCDAHEAALVARSTLQEIGRRLDSPKQLVSTSAVLRAAVELGPNSTVLASALGTCPGTVRHHLYRARREARALRGEATVA